MDRLVARLGDAALLRAGDFTSALAADRRSTPAAGASTETASPKEWHELWTLARPAGASTQRWLVSDITRVVDPQVR